MSKSPDEFDIFAEEVRGVAEAWGTHHWYRSTIDPDELWEAYLSGFEDPEIRQQHNCHCCKSFIKKYGGLVFTNGVETFSPLWPAYTDTKLYTESLSNINKLFDSNRCSIKYPFTTKRKLLGANEDDAGWTHFWVKRNGAYTCEDPGKVAGELATDHEMLVEYIRWVKLNTLTVASELLQGDSTFARSKHAAMVKWLLNTKICAEGMKGSQARRNYLWHSAMSAPKGFCHIKNTVVGVFIHDIESGESIHDARRRLNAAMHPLQYQRPQAAPTEGNIRAAEDLFRRMNLAPSLRRRYAHAGDIQEWLWKPTEREAKEQGIFSHLSREHKKMELPKDSYINNVSWTVFARDVLPHTKSIRIRLQNSMNFAGLVTAAVPDAPPLLHWDREDRRNPVSWYVYHGGSTPASWALVEGEWIDVLGLTLMPSEWHGNRGGFENKVFAVLDGMRDARNCSVGLFPEILRSELREVRATIEAYSRSACIEKTENPVGALALPSREFGAVLEVAGDVLRRYYKIDRWE